jgi:hypothetical protein
MVEGAKIVNILLNCYNGRMYHNWEIMGTCWAFGSTMLITGSLMKLTSRNPIRQSVEMYNRGGGRTSMELDFGITGNGVGMVLRF